MKKKPENNSESPKKRGPKPIEDSDRRAFCLPVRVSANEMEAIKKAAGNSSVTAFVRERLGL